MEIAIADQDHSVAEMFGNIVRDMGHNFSAFTDHSMLLKEIREKDFALILVDWSMINSNSTKMVQSLRSDPTSCPYVILTLARSAKSEVASALRHGADDYILKPEEDAVIRARISAVLRKTPPGADMKLSIQFGRYKLDRLSQTVSLAEKPVELTAKEFDLAELLFVNRDRTLSRGFLMERVWRTNAKLATRTLDMHISRLRSKLQLDGTHGFRIFTVFGHGYRMDTVTPV